MFDNTVSKRSGNPRLKHLQRADGTCSRIHYHEPQLPVAALIRTCLATS